MAFAEIEKSPYDKAEASFLDERLKPEGRSGDGIAHAVALASVTLFAGFTFILVLSSNPRTLSWFAFHPPLQTLAIGLFTYGTPKSWRRTL